MEVQNRGLKQKNAEVRHGTQVLYANKKTQGTKINVLQKFV